MKNPSIDRSLQLFRCSSVPRLERLAAFVPLCVLVLILAMAIQAIAVPLTGANGRVVDFAGIKSAGPAGLKAQIQAAGDVIDLPWDRLDLERLKVEQPDIFAAYEASKEGRTTELNLGSMAPAPLSGTPSQESIKTDGTLVPGRFFTTAGNAKFVIQMPPGGDARGVLLLAIGQDGRSSQFLGLPDRSRWSALVNKLQLAVLAYEFPMGADPKSGIEALTAAPFIAADKGSGEAVIKALENFAKATGKAGLAEAPIAIMGQDVLGAAFAYNFSQAFPDRVIAAVASKGAFYSVKASEASARVPLLILWGEYDEDIKLWKPTDTDNEIYKAGLELKPNWVYAMEPRAGSGETPQSNHLALTFLDRMILARLDGEGKLQDLDRSRSFVGDLNTFKISRMDDPDAVLEPTKTWLPDGEIGKLWEDFSNGVLQIPAAGN